MFPIPAPNSRTLEPRNGRTVSAIHLLKRLVPASDADKRVLLRRLTFDLTGLPPSLEDVEAFQRDDSPAAIYGSST